jgi:hypothetical protein
VIGVNETRNHPPLRGTSVTFTTTLATEVVVVALYRSTVMVPVGEAERDTTLTATPLTWMAPGAKEAEAA